MKHNQPKKSLRSRWSWVSNNITPWIEMEQPSIHERKIIWTKPPWNYVPAVNLRGCTHLKFNIAFENIPSQKESSLPNIIFQGLCLKVGSLIMPALAMWIIRVRHLTNRQGWEWGILHDMYIYIYIYIFISIMQYNMYHGIHIYNVTSYVSRNIYIYISCDICISVLHQNSILIKYWIYLHT